MRNSSPIAIARRAALHLLAALPTPAGLRARFLREKAQLESEEPGTASELVPELLRRADAAHAAGRPTEALDWADKAQQITFHPTLCTADRLLDLLAPWWESVVGSLLFSVPEERTAAPEHSGTSRILVLTAGSRIFVDRVTDAVSPGAQAEFRTVSFDDLLAPGERPTRRGVLEMRWALSTGGQRRTAPPALLELLEWADVVLVEWASIEFAWFSLLEKPRRRTVVRLHRYEAMTPYPRLADLSGVDTVLFIAEHVENLVRGTVPRLRAVPRSEVIQNLHDLTSLRTTKTEGADRTLVQVSWDRRLKDVMFTLDVLEALREQDPSWRLLLVGRTAEQTAPGTQYAAAVMARIARLGDAVEMLGHRDDVPEVLTRAGFLISASLVEGSHEAVAEGAAAGCVPVVRNWPQVAGWGGAHGQFPAEWIVETPADAAARIRGVADPATRAETGERARDWILAARDRVALVRRYWAALLPPGDGA
jgi:glycosyltransferase involved in cell wall biosynthesis